MVGADQAIMWAECKTSLGCTRKRMSESGIQQQQQQQQCRKATSKIGKQQPLTSNDSEARGH
eukprot:1157850-Pelagomonas_calceolata.AAC.20